MLTVSFTTTPSRIGHIQPMVESLTNQSYAPDKIRLNFSGTEEEVPNFLRESGVEVFLTREWGPATKLIPTLEDIPDPEAEIITVDDDIIYESTLIEELVSTASRWPNYAVGKLGLIGIGSDTIFVHSEQYRMSIPFPAVGLAGYRGAFYRRKFFDLPELLQQYKDTTSSIPMCSDDILFSGHLQNRGILMLVVPCREGIVPCGPNNLTSVKINFLNLDKGFSSGYSNAEDIIKYFEGIRDARFKERVK